MAAITTGRKQQGAQSATYYFTDAGSIGSDVVAGVNTDWNALPAGKLKDALNTTYVATDDNTALEVFMAAWSVAGGMQSVVCASNGGYGAWSVSGDGFPVFSFDTVDGSAPFSVRISVSYSASE